MLRQYPSQIAAEHMLYRFMQRSFAWQQSLQNHQQHHHRRGVDSFFGPLPNRPPLLFKKLRRQRCLKKTQCVDRGLI